MKSDSLSDDEIIDDYNRIDAELTEKTNQLLAEKTRSKYLADKLEGYLLIQKKSNRKARWLSVKHTIRDVFLGVVIGYKIGKVI